MRFNWSSWCFLFFATELSAAEDDYNVIRRDGSFEFGYENPDSYHHAQGSRNNVVRGEFGGRNPATGGIDSTVYTAGPRGFRPRGRNVHRKYDLSQSGPRPIGSKDDPYYDPYEDPSYNFAFRTRTYSREENANRVGDVNGKYSYTDDVGERHNVEYIAGKNTGFHVKTPFPDSNPRAYGPLYFTGRGKPIPRGRTSIQRGLDGSYRFVSAGPDQRRTETSDSTGHVRGSYTYLDDKGVQHSVHYIAGPETGYRVLKNVKGPHLPTVFPFGRPSIIPPDFYDYDKDTGDVFDSAASGGGSKPTKDKNGVSLEGGIDVGKEDFDKFENDISSRPQSGGGKPAKPARPSYGDDLGDNDDFGDLFGGPGSSTTVRPARPGSSTTTRPEDDGSYKPGAEDGSYIPPGDANQDNGQYKPSDYEDPSDPGLFPSESNSRPPLGGGGRPPVLHVQGGEACANCQGTVVTNVGDKLFSVPPGVSVRAHVQSIDLLPIIGKAKSPSEQFNEEMNVKTEQLNSAATGLVDDKAETTLAPSAITTTAIPSTTEAQTTETRGTTTTKTTTSTASEEEDENGTEESIF